MFNMLLINEIKVAVESNRGREEKSIPIKYTILYRQFTVPSKIIINVLCKKWHNDILKHDATCCLSKVGMLV